MCRLKHILAAIVFLALVSCEKTPDPTLSISVRHSEVEGEAGSQFVTVKVSEGQSWSLSLLGSDGQEVDWARLDPVSGIGSLSSVTLSCSQNDSGAERTVTLVGISGELRSEAKVVQKVYVAEEPEKPVDDDDPSDIQADEPQPWLELPSMEGQEGLYFITHDMRIAGTTVRNYSYCWDPDALVAHWVAYPLNAQLAGSGSRTDAWGDELDLNIERKIPKALQPILYKGFSSQNGKRYDRGHQCPSADRLASAAINATTFCYTNMTPQLSEFNQNIWASLETRVRSWSYSFDTLYVVTGCLVDGSTEYAYDNIGAAVTVPKAYYKALLGYKASSTIGITGATRGYTGIAFYFEHRNYGDVNYMNEAMTIDNLERRIGLDLFFNLESVIGKERYEKVESTKDNWWWNN